MLVLRTDDGCQVRLAGEELGADRLGLGYATTVHRGQGSTTARAHLFADGGGRELAYVAMSRARGATHAWVVADDPAQAAEDLRRDWSVRRTPTWALDACLPTTTLREAVVSLATPGHAQLVALALAGSRATANASAHLQLVGLETELAKARAALHHAEQARVDLLAGRGAYFGTEVGQTVADLARAEAGLAAVRPEAENGSNWWARRAEAKEAAAWAERHGDARRRWLEHVGPEAARLDAAIGLCRDELARLDASVDRQVARSAAVNDQRRLNQSFVGVLLPGSNSTGTAWTAPDGPLLGVLSHRATHPSDLRPSTLRPPPSVIMTRTSSQVRARAVHAIVEKTVIYPRTVRKGQRHAARTPITHCLRARSRLAVERG